MQNKPKKIINTSNRPPDQQEIKTELEKMLKQIRLKKSVLKKIWQKISQAENPDLPA